MAAFDFKLHELENSSSLKKMIPLFGVIDYLGNAGDLLRPVIMNMLCESNFPLSKCRYIFRDPNLIPPTNLKDGLMLMERLLPAIEEFCKRKPNLTGYIINPICDFCKLTEKPKRNLTEKYTRTVIIFSKL